MHELRTQSDVHLINAIFQINVDWKDLPNVGEILQSAHILLVSQYRASDLLERLRVALMHLASWIEVDCDVGESHLAVVCTEVETLAYVFKLIGD